mmetsp:Transcript_176269/g.565178  ORF Transcript_176269/g.565178 Transcript_176269/m.565178 type:complete len:1124 (-) Transcript_176269:151-3522(-)
MEPILPGVKAWSHIPGYDSDSEGEEDSQYEEEEGGDLTRVATVLDVLGARWQEAPLVRMAPVTLPKEQGKGWGKSVSDRLRRRNSMLPGGSSSILALMRSGGPVPTFRLEHVAAPIVRETCLANGLAPVNDLEFCLMWSGPGLRDPAFKDLHEYQRVNHFPGGSELTRKDNMFEHLNEMARDYGEGAFDFIPESFVLPEQSQAFLESYHSAGGLWIVKPANAACGRGIYIFRNLAKAGLNLREISVVSRYVERPLLIQQLKFDLRIYVVVTQYEPLRAFIYREGLARFASAPYSTEDEGLSDVYRHLTNYSINKKAPNFCENREVEQDNHGHKWSLSAFNKHLKCVGADCKLMWYRIMDLCVKTLFAVEPIIADRTRKVVDNHGVCFEIYGFDILVDDLLKPWILEVNLSPSMQAESPLDWQIKSSLLSDAFNLVGLCNPDFRMIRATRSRTMISQARIAHRKMLQERGSFTGLSTEPTTKEKERERLHTTFSGKPGKPGKPMISEKPLVLDMLSEGQLKMLARSFQEFQRCTNFIRLYPTRSAVERYAPITVPRAKGVRGPSHILASALFGPAPLATEKQKRRDAPASSPSPDAAVEAAEPAARVGPGVPPDGTGTAGKEESRSRSATPPLGEVLPRRRGRGKGRGERAERKNNAEDDVGATKTTADAGQEPPPAEKERNAEQSPSPRAVMEEDGVGAKLDGGGPKLEEDRAEDDAERPSSQVSDSNAASSVQSSPAILSPGDFELERQRALQCLGSIEGDDCWRLLLMEYLARVRRACKALNSKDRTQLAQCSAFARLSAFSRRVSNLRSAWIESRHLTDRSSDEDSDLDTGHLVDEISAVCQSTVRSVAQGDWSFFVSVGDSDPPDPDNDDAPYPAPKRRLDRGVRALARYLPEEFVDDCKGRQALESLPYLFTADLEKLLRSRKCADAFESLRELFKSSDYAATRQASERPSSEGAMYSPINDLTQPQHRGRSDTLSFSSSAPTLPVLMRSKSSVGVGESQSLRTARLGVSFADSPAHRVTFSPHSVAAGISLSSGRRWPPPPPSLERSLDTRRSRRFSTGTTAAASSMSSAPLAVSAAASAAASAADAPTAAAELALSVGAGRRASLGRFVSRGWDLM